MGAKMADNSGRLLGLFDELSSFLTKINLYRGKGFIDTHDLSVFLELYDGNEWTRSTGMCTVHVCSGLTLERSVCIEDFNKSFPALVTGDANFEMTRTSLTLGGFNQPHISRALIELPGNAEKGVAQRFLWLFPEPVYGTLRGLAPVNEEFTSTIGMFLKQHNSKMAINHIIFYELFLF